MSSLPSDLAHRRAEIDKFDREIHRLLIERAKVVYGVIRAKAAATAAGEVAPPFRPGREAEVVRALLARHSGEFPQASLTRIWREIMSGATRMQAVQRIAVLNGDPPLWDLARDHFGSGAEFLKAESSGAALCLVQGMDVAAAVLPMAAADGTGNWWRDLLHATTPEGAPQVVARLPFFRNGAAGDALALSAFPADPSSDDRGIVGVALEEGADPQRTLGPVLAALETSGLASVTAPVIAGGDFWLEVNRMVAPDEPALPALRALPSIARVAVLGGYATPLAATV